jgi:hypothetical protein
LTFSGKAIFHNPNILDISNIYAYMSAVQCMITWFQEDMEKRHNVIFVFFVCSCIAYYLEEKPEIDDADAARINEE